MSDPQVLQSQVKESLGAIGENNQEQQNQVPPPPSANDAGPAPLLEVNILFSLVFIFCFPSLEARHVVTSFRLVVHFPSGVLSSWKFGVYEISQPFAFVWYRWFERRSGVNNFTFHLVGLFSSQTFKRCMLDK